MARSKKPPLTVDGIRQAVLRYLERTGRLPSCKSGDATEDFGFTETWSAVNDSLRWKGRGLSGGSSLAKFLTEQDIGKLSHKKVLEAITEDNLVKAALNHKARLGRLPSVQEGGKAFQDIGFQISWRRLNKLARLQLSISLREILIRRNLISAPPPSLEEVNPTEEELASIPEVEALMIRAWREGGSQVSIAEKFKVSQPSISYRINRGLERILHERELSSYQTGELRLLLENLPKEELFRTNVSLRDGGRLTEEAHETIELTLMMVEYRNQSVVARRIGRSQGYVRHRVVLAIQALHNSGNTTAAEYLEKIMKTPRFSDRYLRG